MPMLDALQFCRRELGKLILVLVGKLNKVQAPVNPRADTSKAQ